MSVTVVIVNWNGGDLVAKCVEHLGRQSVLPDRIYLVDNASSDKSADRVQQIKNLEILKMDGNLGFAAGNNRAFELCETDFVVLLNPDAFAAPDWLEQLLIAAKKYPEAAAFGSRQLQDLHPEILDDIGDCYHVSGLVWQEGYGVKQRSEHLIEGEIFSPCAAAALYRTGAVKSVGGFDEDFFCYMEDVDLAFRLRLAGHTVRYVPQAVVRHVGSATSGGKHSDFSVYHGHRNALWTFIRDMPGALFWLFLPLHLAMSVLILLRFSLNGQTRVIWRSKFDAVRGIPRAWEKRIVTQRTRTASLCSIWRALDKRLWMRPRS